MADGKEKAYSAPLPLRAIGDQRLAGLDLRTLACIAAHDHMSLKLCKGLGCHASHETLAAKIGCNYINLGKSIRKLEALGYLDCSRQPGRSNYHTYRIPAHLYDGTESLSFHQPSAEARAEVSSKKVGQSANELDEKVCHGTQKTQTETDSSPDQYISLSDETYSAEADEKYSSEDARFAARGASQGENEANVGGNLARFERLWKANPNRFDLPSLEQWADYFDRTQEIFECGDPEYGQAQRLAADIDEQLGELRNGHAAPVSAEQIAELTRTLARAKSA